jgi:hypothetical protein
MFRNHRLENIRRILELRIANTSPISSNFASINDVASWGKRTPTKIHFISVPKSYLFPLIFQPVLYIASRQIKLVADKRSQIDRDDRRQTNNTLFFSASNKKSSSFLLTNAH